MKIEIFQQADAFLEMALPLLEKEEAANNLMIGVAMRFTTGESSRFFLCAVMEEDTPVLLALMTTANAVQISASKETPDAALALVAHALREGNWTVSGVMAEPPVARRFSEIWSSMALCNVSLHKEERILACVTLKKPRFSPGAMRPARAEEKELLVEWMLAFQRDVDFAVAFGMEEVHTMVEGDIAAGRIFVWDAGGPVCMARRIRPTAHGAAIGGVYTPPTLRGRGFASSLVASLTQHIFDSGKEFACLFADCANPTSNKIYRSIGYEPVRDLLYYVFH